VEASDSDWHVMSLMGGQWLLYHALQLAATTMMAPTCGDCPGLPSGCAASPHWEAARSSTMTD